MVCAGDNRDLRRASAAGLAPFVDEQTIEASVYRLYWRLARLIFVVWRFQTLHIVKCLMRGSPSPCIAQRPFAGAELYVDVSRSTAQGSLYLEGERFVGERFLLKELVKPGMRIVDVGANVGCYVLMLRQMGGDACDIIAIEPSPENLPELRANIANNRWDNVRLVEAAVGAEAGNVAFLSGINGGVADEGAYTVPIVTLDTLLKSRVDFLKIDVEGFEGYALQGAIEVLKRDRPVLFLEFHPHLVGKFGHSFETMRSILAPIYGLSNIECYAVRRSPSLIKKVAERYFHADPVVRSERPFVDSDALGTCWIVCTRATCSPTTSMPGATTNIAAAPMRSTVR
ncbi:MAG: hypothetical protein C0483_17640 [Pirellula sp.]|nr:hypothetical protein [Pirellula sp.]